MSRTKLTNNERAVLDAIKKYRKVWTDNPTQCVLSGMANVSQSQVSLILRRLADKGKIILGHRGKIKKVK